MNLRSNVVKQSPPLTRDNTIANLKDVINKMNKEIESLKERNARLNDALEKEKSDNTIIVQNLVQENKKLKNEITIIKNNVNVNTKSTNNGTNVQLVNVPLVKNLKKYDNLRVALCAIAKNENLYIREWVEWYKNLGVCKIFLYDNNETDGERFEDVINDYIESGFVEIINVRGKEKGCVYDEQGINLQTSCYIDAYENKCANIDWIMFFDIDEFLKFRNGSNLQEFLHRDCFNNYDTICVSWETYDDNNLIEYDNKPVMKRFTRISKYNRHGIKSIVRTGKHIENKKLRNMIHNFTINKNSWIYANGSNVGIKITKNKRWWLASDKSHNSCDVVLNHYKTKSVEEYFKRHLERHWGTSKDISNTSKSIITCLCDYVLYNNLDDNKLTYINKLFENVKQILIIEIDTNLFDQSTYLYELTQKITFAEKNKQEYDEILLINFSNISGSEIKIKNFVNDILTVNYNVIKRESYELVKQIININNKIKVI